MGLKQWITGRFAGNPGDRSPWGSFWFSPIGSHSAAGFPVTADLAMQLSAVYACMRIISSQFASLPFVLYRDKPNGGKEKIKDHPIYTLLAKRPNQFQNAFEWREMMAGHLILRGNAFNLMQVDGKGAITALLPLHPDRIKIQVQPNGNYAYQYTQLDGSQVMYTRGEIWHIRGLSSDGIVGMSVIAMARNSIAGAISAQDCSARFFANDARPSSGWVEMPNKFPDKDARDKFRESLHDAMSGINKGKLAVLEFGMKYHEIGVSNDDAQFLETRQFQVNDIARWFGVPPHKIADLSRSTNNNIEQQALEFVQDCLGPMAERWEASIEAELLLDSENLECEFSFSQLMRGDSAARTLYYNGGINGGWLTRNEARIAENLDPLPGLDKPLLALNMIEEGQIPENNQKAPPKQQPNQPPNDQAESLVPARLAAISQACAERVARKEVEMVIKAHKADDKGAALVAGYEKHVGFVAAALSVSRDVSAAYCVEQIDVAQGDFEAEEFTQIAQMKLEKLALKGSL